jgi:hypothetical protein
VRWIHADDNIAAERAQREAVLVRIDAWWAAFERAAPTIRASFKGQATIDLPAFMAQHLHVIDNRLCWEFGPGVHKPGDRLVITPEGDHELRPLVDVILKRAPNLPDWEFFAYRLPDPTGLVGPTVQARTGGDITDVRVTPRRGAHNRVDLLFHHPRCTGADDQRARHDAFVTTETLLGEETLDRWIGVIDVEPVSQPGALRRLLGGKSRDAGVPLDRLKQTVEALTGSIVDQLPDVPVRSWPVQRDPTTGEEICVVMRIDPVQRPSYPGYSDLWMFATTQPELVQSVHSGTFHSRRFSRVGETFAYLKIDHEGQAEHVVAFRAKLEDALQPVLERDDLGSLFGGGTGIEFVYLFLALQDVNQAIPVIRDTLQAAGAPARSWLMFYDNDLIDEWVGIHPHTPPPPEPVE